LCKFADFESGLKSARGAIVTSRKEGEKWTGGSVFCGEPRTAPSDLAPSDEGAVAQRLRERRAEGFFLRWEIADNLTFSLPPPFGHLPHQREARG